MDDIFFKNPIDQEFFDLTKNFDIQDWRDLRDDNYWYEECPFTNVMKPREKVSKLELIRYYVKHGVKKPT